MASELIIRQAEHCQYSFDVAEAVCRPHWGEGWPAVISCGVGWTDVVVYAVRIGEAYDWTFELHQVKEKFGGLRFYSSLPRHAEAMIEGLASGICEACGDVGVMCATITKGWFKTLCAEHLAIEGPVDSEPYQRYWPVYDHPADKEDADADEDVLGIDAD